MTVLSAVPLHPCSPMVDSKEGALGESDSPVYRDVNRPRALWLSNVRRVAGWNWLRNHVPQVL